MTDESIEAVCYVVGGLLLLFTACRAIYRLFDVNHCKYCGAGDDEEHAEDCRIKEVHG